MNARFIGGAVLLTLLGAAEGPAAAAPGKGSKPSDLPGLVDAGARVPAGTWARYTLLDRRSNKAASIRVAVFGKEAGGRWLELSFTDPRRRRIVYRTLVSDFGSAKSPPRVLKAIVQPPFQRPLLLPEQLARRQAVPLRHRGARGQQGKVAGRPTVRTAAGSFKTWRYLRVGPGGEQQQTWVTESLRGFPLVRYRSRYVDLELVGHGRDAESEIKGRPVKLAPGMLRHLPQP